MPTHVRKGTSGRIPDSAIAEHEYHVRRTVTLPPDLMDRLQKFCDVEERAYSWVAQKALDQFLTERGY